MPDWRELLRAIIENGTPIAYGGRDYPDECQYCPEWLMSGAREHGAACAWRTAEEALSGG